MRVPVRNRGKLSGFTLVEMAIVLVIIGIILAGVMKGRDIVRGSQIKAFAQQFAMKWGTVAQTYYDKTGQFLNDGSANGGAAGAANGFMDGSMQTRINTAAPGGIVAILESVGIMPCNLIKSKVTTIGSAVVYIAAPAVSCLTATGAGTGMNLIQTQVESEFCGTTNVSADLTAINYTPPSLGSAVNRNIVLLANVPTDVAIGLDTIVDGTPNGAAGNCINLSGTGRTPNTVQAAIAPAATTGSLIPAANIAVWPAASAAQTHTVAIILDF